MPWLASFVWAYSTCDEREPTVGFEPGTFRLRSECAKRWAIRADKYQSPKGDRIIPECAINGYLYRVVDIYLSKVLTERFSIL